MKSKENQKYIKNYLNAFIVLFIGFVIVVLAVSSSHLSDNLHNAVFYMAITGSFVVLLSLIIHRAKINQLVIEGLASVREKEEVIEKLIAENNTLKEQLKNDKQTPQTYEQVFQELQISKAKIDSLIISLEEKDNIIKGQNWKVWFAPCCKAIGDTIKENVLRLELGNEVKIKKDDFYDRVAAHHTGPDTFPSAAKKAWDLLPDIVKNK